MPKHAAKHAVKRTRTLHNHNNHEIENTTVDATALAPTFRHADVEITLTPDGQFTAVVNGVRVRKPSLDAMKAHIDKHSNAQFKPFAAWTKTWKGPLQKVVVKGVVQKKGRSRRWGPVYEFLTEPPNLGSGKLIMDSLVNLAAVKTAEKYSKETDKITDARYEAQQKLEAKVKYIKAEDHLRQGK